MNWTDGDLRIRKYRFEDRERLAELGDNPNVSRFLADRFPGEYTLRVADDWIEAVGKENPACNFALEWRDALVGGIGVEPFEDVHSGTAGLGYWLGEPYWGLGIATRAVRLFAPYVFDELLFIRLQAIVFEGNPASCRVLEKNGFVREGVMRRHVRKHGRIRDAILYAKLRDDPANAP